MAEEGLTKTENELIHIGRPIPFDVEVFLAQLEVLMYVAYSNKESIRNQVQKMVSTYHPMDLSEPVEKDERYRELANESRQSVKGI